MQVLKKDKDGTAVADRPIFILETEETILGILVKYFLLPEAGCLQLYLKSAMLIIQELLKMH